MTAITKVTSIHPSTPEELATAIDIAMKEAGFTGGIVDMLSANKTLTYPLDMGTGAGYAPLALRVTVKSTFYVEQELLTQWDESTDTYELASSSSSSRAIASNDYLLLSCNHAEIKTVVVYNTSGVKKLLGYLRPSQKPSWWDETIYPYVFFVSDLTYSVLYNFPSDLSPFNSYDYNLASYADMKNPNTITGKIDLLSGLALFADSEHGVVGLFGEDVCRASAGGLSPGSLCVVEANQQYILLSAGASALAVKSAWPIEY